VAVLLVDSGALLTWTGSWYGTVMLCLYNWVMCELQCINLCRVL